MLQNYFTTIFTPVKGGGAKILTLEQESMPMAYCASYNLL